MVDDQRNAGDLGGDVYAVHDDDVPGIKTETMSLQKRVVRPASVTNDVEPVATLGQPLLGSPMVCAIYTNIFGKCKRRERRHTRRLSTYSQRSPSSHPVHPFRTPIKVNRDPTDSDDPDVDGFQHRFIFPPHAAKNEYILAGYKAPTSAQQALTTLIYCDNETANVWTSLSGLIPLMILASNILIKKHPTFDPTGIFIAMGLFVINILLTSMYHLFNQVPHLYAIWSSLDFAGINCAICSLSFAMSWYGYRLWPDFSWHLEFGIVCAIALVMTSVSTVYRHVTDHDPFWLQVVNLLAITLVLSAFHSTMPMTSRNVSFMLFLGFGAAVHVLKVPERLAPGAFCFFGHSHMIWHLCYTLAFYCFYSSMIAEQVGGELLWDDILFGSSERFGPTIARTAISLA